MVAEIGIYLALGAVVGIIAPAAGIAGGLLMVPAFLFLFPRFGIAPDLVAHLAVGSSLGAATLMSISSIRSHARAGSVEWKIFLGLAPGLVLGAVGGGLVAHLLADNVLHQVFGGLLLAIALWLAAGFSPRRADNDTPRFGTGIVLPTGFAIGALGTMIGIGGGVMLVPFLLITGLAAPRAAGTSSAAVFVIVLTGSLTYLVVGHGVHGLPPATLGYLYGPAVIATAATAMAFAPLGARLGRALPPKVFRRLFALLLVVVAAKLLFF